MMPEVDNTYGAVPDALPEAPTIAAPTIGETFSSAANVGNDVVNAYQFLARRHTWPADPNFNLRKTLEDDNLFATNNGDFVGVKSLQEYGVRKAEILQQNRDLDVLARSGKTGVAASLGMGLLSPTMFLPFIGEARGIKGIAQTTRNALAAALISEVPILANQPNKPVSDVALDIGAQTVLGAILGGAHVMLRPGEQEALVRSFNQGEHMAVRPGGTPIPAGASTPIAESAGGIAPGGGLLQRAMDSNQVTRNPVTFNLAGESDQMRWMTAQTADSGLALEGNKFRIPTTPGGTVENRVPLYYALYGKTAEKLDELYRNYYYKGEDAGAFGGLKARAGGNFSIFRAEGQLSRAQFNAEVTRAGWSGDLHPDPHVQEAAQFMRQTVFDPILKRLQEAGLLGDQVNVLADKSYVHRLFDHGAIIRDTNGFVQMLANKFEQKLNAEFSAGVEKLSAKAAKDTQTTADLKLSAEDVAAAKQEHLAKLEALNTQRSPELTSIEDQLSVQRASLYELRQRHKDAPDIATKLSLEKDIAFQKDGIKALEGVGGQGLTDVRQARKAIADRVSNLNRAQGVLQSRQLAKLEKASILEDKSIESLRTVARAGQRVLNKLDSLSDKQLDKEISDLNDKFEKLASVYDRGEERIAKLKAEDPTAARLIDPEVPPRDTAQTPDKQTDGILPDGGSAVPKSMDEAIKADPNAPRDFNPDIYRKFDDIRDETGEHPGNALTYKISGREPPVSAPLPEWFAGIKQTMAELSAKLGLPFEPKLYVGKATKDTRAASDPWARAIVLGDHLSKETAVATALHEFGHQVETQIFRLADEETQRAILADFNAHAGRDFDSMTLEQLRTITDQANPDHARALEDFTPQFQKYVTNWKEWSAEQVATWLTKATPPQTVVEKYFKGIADLWKAIYERVKGHVGTADSVKKFLEGRWRGEDNPRLQKLQTRQTVRAGRLTDITDKIEFHEGMDRDLVRAQIGDQLEQVISRTQDLNARRALREAKLREEAKALDPQKAIDRIAGIHARRAQRESDFLANIRERGGNDVGLDKSGPAYKGTADFGKFAEQGAREVKDKILGTTLRSPTIDMMQGDRAAVLARVLDISSHDLEPWLDTDIERIVRTYLRTSGPDIELAKKFGDVQAEKYLGNGGTLVEEMNNKIAAIETQLDKKGRPLSEAAKAKESQRITEHYALLRKNFEAIVKRLRHQDGLPTDPNALGYRLGKAALNINTLRFMGGVTLSSLPDAARVIMRYGALRTFRDGFVPLVRNFAAFKMGAQEIKYAGAANEIVSNARGRLLNDIFDDMHRGSKFEQGLEWAASKQGIVGAFAYWTDAMKMFTGVVGNAKILDSIAETMTGKSSAKTAEFLAQNGIGPGEAAQIWDQVVRNGGGQRVNGVWMPNTEAWDNPAAQDAFRAAVNREVNNAIVTPGVERPLWMTGSMTGRLLGQFKSFTFSSTTRMLQAGLQQRDMAVAEGMALSLAFGALSYYLYAAAAGGSTEDEMRNAGPGKWADEAIARSGIEGALGLGQDLLSRIPATQGISSFSGGRTLRHGGGSLVEALAGPTFDAVETGARVVSELNNPDSGTVHAARKLVLWQNVTGIRRIFDAVEAAIPVPEKN